MSRWLRSQPACKPGSVRRQNAVRRPFLWDAARAAPRATYPDDWPGAGRRLPAASSLFGLAPGGVYHAATVAGRAVGSYPTLSPLPRDPKAARRSALCGTVPGVTPAGRYPAPFLLGARTFLPRGLSTIAAAVARPAGCGRCRPAAGRCQAPTAVRGDRSERGEDRLDLLAIARRGRVHALGIVPGIVLEDRAAKRAAATPFGARQILHAVLDVDRGIVEVA